MLKPTNIGREIGDAPRFILKDLIPNNMPNWDTIAVIAEMMALQGCPQDVVHHAEGDVWTHTQMVIEALQKHPHFEAAGAYKQYLLLISALLHDIGKPSCTKVEDGRIVSPHHAQAGAKMARLMLWDEDFALREEICSLVRLHGLPLWALEKPHPHIAVSASSLRLSNQDLHCLATADIEGRTCQDEREMLDRLDLFQELCLENECFDAPRLFYNDHSRFKYFANSLTYPPAMYDDTEFEVILMCGVAGSGKDTYIAENFDLPIVSLDTLRTQMKVKPRDKKGQGRVIQAAYQMAKDYGAKKQPFVWNAMNLTTDLRQKVITKLSPYNPKFKIVYLETSQENILERRQGEIPASDLQWMMRQLEMPQSYEAHEVIYVQT